MRRVLFVLAVTLLAAAARAQELPDPNLPPAPVHEQVLHLAGDPFRPVDLVVTLYTPDGPGPFPLAIFNHGGNSGAGPPATRPRLRYAMPAFYFLSRGYAVALPMMRGFSGSGGQQSAFGCDLAKFALANGRDIEGVIAGLAANKHVDTRRVVVAGEDFGGWNTLGLGALQPQGVRGLINFNGELGLDACPDSSFQNLVAAAGRLGEATRIPGLWFYGKDDELRPDTVARLREAYVRNGAKADLVDVDRLVGNSSQIFTRPRAIPEWTSRLDAFLKRIGMPSREAAPDYLPHPWPKPSHFAELADVEAVPGLKAKGRDSYRHFLTLPYPRAFVISAAGVSATAVGGFDPLAHAEALCAAHHIACVPYAVDDDVVFARPDAAPVAQAASGSAAIGDVAAVPWVNDKGRASYRAFLQRPSPRAFVVGTGGEAAATFGGPDPLGRAMALCAKNHIVCRAYAVDDAIVWQALPPPRPLPATHFAALDDVAAVPWVNAGSRATYAKFLTMKLPRAFAVAPGGQAAATQGGYDPLGRALEKCKQAGLACRPYAVDNAVVWTPPKP